MPELGCEAVPVEHVVDDLEEEPNSAAKPRHGACSDSGTSLDRERAADGGLEQPPRLQGNGAVRDRRRRLYIVVLTADHPDRRPGELARDIRVG